MYRVWLKRGFDCIFSALILMIGCIPMLVIAALIKLESPGPALFHQDRIGKDGKVFEMIKFRSMYQGTEHSGTGVYSDMKDDRLTKIGRFMRKTSIDELPQCINILKGDMSFIGPRPPLTYHPWPYEKYTDEQKRMFEVRPGITGWAQVHGRRTVEWNKRIELNTWYVDHVSFLLDLEILFMTIFKVVLQKDNENVGATAKEN